MAEVLWMQPMESRADDKLPAISAMAAEENPPVERPEGEAKDDHSFLLPDIQKREMDSSAESLIKALGLSKMDEQSLGRLLKTVRGEVLSTIDELRTITTHDDNLERQYKEVVSENVQLNSALEKARGEIRHLKGQLSVLQMTSPEIRKYKARLLQRERRKIDHEHQLQQTRQKYMGVDPLPVFNFAERARTVNARGEYIDNRLLLHSRHSTYPPAPRPVPLSSSLPARPLTDALPPPLLGCRCSMCNAQQSLGAVTLGTSHSPPQSQQTRTSSHLTKSGQQILLGDRVIVKGERPGVVRYIGRLEADVQGQIFIGVHLVMPVGTCDGSLRGRHYFQCPPLHGVFVKPAEVLCVTGRKPCTGGTIVPRLQEKAPFDPGSTRRGNKLLQTPLHEGPQTRESLTPGSSHSASTATRARAILQEELAKAHAMLGSPNELFDPSVKEMSQRMEILAMKNKHKQKQKQQQQQNEEEMVPSESNHSPVPAQPELQPTPLEPTPPPPQLPLLPPSPPPPPPHTPTPLPPHSPYPPPAIEGRVVTPPPLRPETPMEMMLLRELQTKDIGNTGFVTGNEIAATLTHLSKGKACRRCSKCKSVLSGDA